MTRLDCFLVDDIVQSCLSLYEKLPKTGKPVDGEWTVLSCVVKREAGAGGGHELVALGTGTKCVGAGAAVGAGAGAGGTLLLDGHAEVVARRGLLRYLLHHAQRALASSSAPAPAPAPAPAVFHLDHHGLSLKPNTEFIFYSSQLPCGDASIVPKCDDEEPFGDLLQNKRRAEDDACSIERKRNKVEDIHRTGAKCLKGQDEDPHTGGVGYHVTGAVRTKPGRGDPTLSASCSDKLARWAHVGLQGALLHSLCGQVHIKHYIFGGGVPYSEQTLKRAFLNRKGDKESTLTVHPEFYQSSLKFPHARCESTTRPAPGSIIWTSINNSDVEVAVRGKKLGLTKKQASNPKHALCITKYKLYSRYLSILRENEDLKRKIVGEVPLEKIPYNEMKRKCESYNRSWAECKEKFFGCWTVKPDVWNFVVDDP